MQQLASYLSGAWQTGRGHARTIHHAISGEALWEVTSAGLDMAQARRFAIERGGKALGAMTFIERSAMLKALARYLLEQKAELYTISAETGATRADSWVDIEGGIGTLFTYAGLGSRELPDDTLWPEDELIPLSKQEASPPATCSRQNPAWRCISTPLTFPAGACWKSWRPPGLPVCRPSSNWLPPPRS